MIQRTKPKTYSEKIASLEAAEHETWFGHIEALRRYDELNRPGSEDQADQWKRRADALLYRHRRIMSKTMFLHRHRIYGIVRHPNYQPGRWMGCVRGGALERAVRRG